MQQLSELDASFLHLESRTTPMHIGGVYLFDGSGRQTPLSFETFAAYLRSRLHVAHFFRQRLLEVPFGLDLPYWVDDPDFSIERHLTYVRLNGQRSVQAIINLAERVIEEPLRRDRPLWHITFVDGLESGEELPPQSFAIIIRVHHAAIDAFSGEDIMGTLLEYSANPRPLGKPRPWRPRPLPSTRRLLLSGGANAVRKPFRMAQLGRLAFSGALRSLLTTQLRRLPLPRALFNAPRSPFNRNITGRRQLVSVNISLARLKQIKAAIGDVTLNDVVLGLCAEMLNRYLERHDCRPDKPLIAMTPVSVRSKSLRRPMGNQMSAMMLSLATDEPDPARRIRVIHQNAVVSEEYQQAIAADRLTELVPSTLLGLSVRLYSEFQLAQNYRPMFNVPITNVPGPQVPLYLQGARLIRQFNFAPLFDGMALVIVAVSYEGTLALNLTLAPDVLADGDTFKELALDSLAAIESAAAKLPEDDVLMSASEKPGDSLLLEAFLDQAEVWIDAAGNRLRRWCGRDGDRHNRPPQATSEKLRVR